MTTTVNVTAGQKRYRWARVTETTGADLDVAEVQVSLTPVSGLDAGVHTWQAPDDSEQVSDSVVRAAILVDNGFDPGQYRLYVKVTDNPEVDFIQVKNSLVKVV